MRGSVRGRWKWGLGGAAVNTYSFFFNDTATTEIYTLSLHDALPILEDMAEYSHIGKCHDPVCLCHHRMKKTVKIGRAHV